MGTKSGRKQALYKKEKRYPAVGKRQRP